MIAQILMNILGSKFDHRTTRTPYLSAMKLKGMVTTKSNASRISRALMYEMIENAHHIRPEWSP